MTAPEPTAHDPGCWFHGAEPIPDGAYLVCGECGHCYVTAADLIDTERRVLTEVGHPVMATIYPDTIYACPLCAHDF